LLISDFLGEVILKGLDIMHPESEEFLADITPPFPDGADSVDKPDKILGKVRITQTLHRLPI